MKNFEIWMLTSADFKGMFALLEYFIKPLLAREIERENIDRGEANARWVAWMTSKRLALAMSRSGIDPEELIAWLEACAKERKAETLTSPETGAQNL